MDDQPRVKQAACLVCRRSKIRCDYRPGEGRCKRCIQLKAECVRPDFHPGRQKGIKNKRVGLDKALFQVEQAVKRACSSGTTQTPDDDKVVAHLRNLLAGLEGGASSQAPGNVARSRGAERQDDVMGDDDDDDEYDDGDEEDEQTSPAGESTDLKSNSMSSFSVRPEESLAIDDAENPLQLLARASYFQPAEEARSRKRPSSSHTRTRSQLKGQNAESQRLREFFSSARVHLDVGDKVDPINLGLVTESEAESLLSFFHANLAHTRWGMDPRIYDVAFMRSRSAFLLTSVMASSTLFTPQVGALSKRLFNHVRALAHRVVTHGYKSVEIVLAFMVNVPWMFPGNNATDDETCEYISLATSIAIDLSLHKVVMPTEMLSQANRPLARAECIDPKTALLIDGFPEVDPWSEKGSLLLRSRERTWISLFVLERGMSLARGRPFTVPITRSIRACDNWHRSSLADPRDSHVVSMAVLRRDLDGMFSTVRALCDGSQNPSSDGSLIARSIESAIEQFFDSWFSEWGASLGTGPQWRLPPYVEILVTHTRLSGYANVINHPTAPVEVRRFFRTAGLSSALNVLRVAIQGESQLQSMPNNTAIMISFAACFALTLSAYTTGESALAPSVRKLIDEAAGVLERIGAVTPHRNGLSTLYGKYLRQIVKRAAAEEAPLAHGPSSASYEPRVVPLLHTALEPQAPMHAATILNPPLPPPGEQQDQRQMLWPEPLQFSTMSNDQILQVLNQPGNDFQPSFDGLSFNDMNNFDWLNWPEFGA